MIAEVLNKPKYTYLVKLSSLLLTVMEPLAQDGCNDLGCTWAVPKSKIPLFSLFFLSSLSCYGAFAQDGCNDLGRSWALPKSQFLSSNKISSFFSKGVMEHSLKTVVMT